MVKRILLVTLSITMILMVSACNNRIGLKPGQRPRPSTKPCKCWQSSKTWLLDKTHEGSSPIAWHSDSVTEIHGEL